MKEQKESKKRITFLVSLDEFEILKDKAWKNKLSLSEYLRKILFFNK